MKIEVATNTADNLIPGSVFKSKGEYCLAVDKRYMPFEKQRLENDTGCLQLLVGVTMSAGLPVWLFADDDVEIVDAIMKVK